MRIRLRVIPLAQVLIGFLLLATGAGVQYRFRLIERYIAPRFWQTQSVKPQTMEDLIGKKSESVDLSQFWEAWQYLEQDYIDPTKTTKDSFVEGAIGGLAASLKDAYTFYLPPKENQRSAEDLAGAFYGIGIELGYVDQILAVVAPLKGTPAEAAGIQPGDLIIRVKDAAKNIDEESARWTLEKAVDTIRGPAGSSVTLSLSRKDKDNGEPFDVTVARGEIVVKSAELDFPKYQGKTIAHIQLHKFGGRTNGEWTNIVEQILARRSEISGIVLDMRNNPGGFFDGAIDVASEFIPSGVIVQQQGKFSSESFEARGGARLTNIPLVVLVNKGSASASEIVAGALRDRLGIKLVGEQTFGKGTVQDQRQLSGGGGLHITIARWLLPSGDWINQEGIPVNVQVKDNPETPIDEALNQAIETL